MQGADVGDGVAVLTRGDTIVFLWKEAATAPRWAWQQERVRNFLASREDAIWVIVILESSTPPNATLRARMQLDFRMVGPKLRRLVAVPIGTSLWMSVVRTIVRGVLLVSGLARLHVLAGSVEEAVERVREVAGPDTPSASTLREMVETLHRAVTDPPAEPSVWAP